MSGALPASVLSRAYALEQPLNAYLELTYTCNWRCEFCYNPRHFDLQGLSEREWIDVLDQLRPAGTLNVTLTGGEPPAHPGWASILDAAVERRFVVSLYTNGSLIDAAAADRIARSGSVTVEISLHGSSAEIHDATTARAGSFDAMLSGLSLLKERDVTVHLKSPITKRNEHQIGEMIAIAERFDVPYRLDGTLVPRHNGDLSPLALMASPDARRRIIEIGLGTGSVEPIEERQSGTANCGLGRITLAIGPEGDVYPCIQWRHSSAGNLRHAPFAEIWKSLERSRIAAMSTAANEMLRERPDSSIAPYCPAVAAYSTGDALKPDTAFEQRNQLTADVLARRRQ